MAITKDSASAHPSALRLSARLQRGIILAEERFEEIHRIAPYIWSVPSCTGAGVYVVDLKAGECSCPDRPPAPEKCKHLSAAAYKKAKTATCAGCGERVRHRELVEVGGDNSPSSRAICSVEVAPKPTAFCEAAQHRRDGPLRGDRLVRRVRARPPRRRGVVGDGPCRTRSSPVTWCTTGDPSSL